MKLVHRLSMAMNPWQWSLRTEITTLITVTESVSNTICGNIFPSEQLAAWPHSNHYVWKHLSSQISEIITHLLCVETEVYYVWKHNNTRMLSNSPGHSCYLFSIY